jgi:O-6-methylguanine DNA methyltransferase
MAPSPPEWLLTIWSSPLGPLCLTFTPKGLARLEFTEGTPHYLPLPEWRVPSRQKFPLPEIVSIMTATLRALADYFAGTPTDFATLPMDLQGTTFQLKVWQELRKIPWGTTISYKELARRVDNPKGTQAVGQANGANPLPIIIPCHRVIRANGKLGGYSSGLDRKRWLLEHEGAMRG